MKKIIKKIAAAILSAAMSAGLFAMNASAASFTDMNPDHWAYETVNLMAQEGVISGYDDGTFRPNDPVTLQEFAALALRAISWPINRSEPKNIYFEHENSESFAEDAARIRACLNGCDEWARPYVAGLISDISPYDPDDIKNKYPSIDFNSYMEVNCLMFDAFSRPTEPVPRWITFEILTAAAKYNGSESGNKAAYDADYPVDISSDGMLSDYKTWGYNLHIGVENYDFPYIRELTYSKGQRACRDASRHGLVVVEKVANNKYPGETLASANPYATLTRAEAAALIARLKHPERRIYNMEINPVQTTFYRDILNSMGIQPTIMYETPMAQSEYTIEQTGTSWENYKKMIEAYAKGEDWTTIMIED